MSKEDLKNKGTVTFEGPTGPTITIDLLGLIDGEVQYKLNKPDAPPEEFSNLHSAIAQILCQVLDNARIQVVTKEEYEEHQKIHDAVIGTMGGPQGEA